MNIEKIIKKLPVGFLDEASGMDGDRLREVIVDAETAIRESDIAKEHDERLTGAKEIVKDISSGYGDVTKAQRAKIAYALHLLEERGELGVERKTTGKSKKKG